MTTENIFNEEANRKKFYSYVKSKRQVNVSVSALKVNGSYVVDDVKKANVLNNQYSSVFSKPDNNIPEIKTPEIGETIPDIIIPTDGVKSLLDRVNPTKATGPDDITSRFLHEFSNELAPALTLIFLHHILVENYHKIGYMRECHQYTKGEIKIAVHQKNIDQSYLPAFVVRFLNTLYIAIS